MRRRSITSCSSSFCEAPSSWSRWPSSASISLKASTSVPTSSCVVLATRSEKSLRSTTPRAAEATARMGWVKTRCSHSENRPATSRLATITAARMPR